jgi:hypothetical protein
MKNIINTIKKENVEDTISGKVGKVYFIKHKNFNEKIVSIRGNNNTGDLYIVANKLWYKNVHKNKDKELMILHELGHILSSSKIHLINEVKATIYGWYKYNKFSTIKIGFIYVLFFMIRRWKYFIFNKI